MVQALKFIIQSRRHFLIVKSCRVRPPIGVVTVKSSWCSNSKRDPWSQGSVRLRIEVRFQKSSESQWIKASAMFRMTREQWVRHLRVLRGERYCLSCWLFQVKEYLTERLEQFVLKSLLAGLRRDWTEAVAISKDCRCDLMSTSSSESTSSDLTSP